MLDEAAELAPGSDVARVWIDLERGRLRRSSGDREAAFPLFESAFATAQVAGEGFAAGDAAHMAALAAPDREGFVAWTQRGVALAEENEAASYWLGPLLNNVGWEHYEAGEYALRARRVRARAPCARARARDSRRRSSSRATPSGRRSVLSDARTRRFRCSRRPSRGQSKCGRPDGWFHEELAEEYAAAGRLDDARGQARLAIPLLERRRSLVPGRRGAPAAARCARRRAPRAGCSRACAGARARASRAPSRAPRRARAASAVAGSRRRRNRAPQPCTGWRSAPCTRR